MTESDNVQGLGCPNCGGMVPIPEGMSIVRCPFCSRSAFVKGERGLRRYQVPQKILLDNARAAMSKFLSSKMSIARDAARTAQVTETFLIYLPFWTVWGRIAGWAFGEKKITSNKSTRYEPREVRMVEEMTWTGAACDVGEFGVTQLKLERQVLEPFNADALHSKGMVFEPVNSASEANDSAELDFEEHISQRANLDRLSQLFVRTFRQRFGLVYYPLWVLRYLYRGRSYQVVVDGYNGEVLYGKAPGSVFFRAAVLVLGMALGAFIAIDGTALLAYLFSDSDDFPVAALAVTVFGGAAIMYTAYRRFRYGEQIEHRTLKEKKTFAGLDNPLNIIRGITQSKEIERWTKELF